MNLARESELLVNDACGDLLLSLKFRGTPRGRVDVSSLLARPDSYLAGLVDFSSKPMWGTVVLMAEYEFFASTQAAMAKANPLQRASALQVRDWAMELSNQLLGRIKNKLCAIGVSLDSGLPRAVSGHAVAVSVRSFKTLPYVFGGDGQTVVAWCEASVDATAEIGAPATVVGEGDIVVF